MPKGYLEPDQISPSVIERCYQSHFSKFIGSVKELVCGSDLDTQQVLAVVKESGMPMIDVILNVDQKAWSKLVKRFETFEIKEACKRTLS